MTFLAIHHRPMSTMPSLCFGLHIIGNPQSERQGFPRTTRKLQFIQQLDNTTMSSKGLEGNSGGVTGIRTSVASASPWNLRSYYQRNDHHRFSRTSPEEASFSSPATGLRFASRAKDIFTSAGEGTTRIGMVDGQEVIFELQQDVTNKPTNSKEERHHRTIQSLNVTGSSLEMRFRWWLLRFSLVQSTLLYFVVFVAINLIFAGLWNIQGGQCCGDETMTYFQTFDFSIQTSATIGYGGYVPDGRFANFLVVVLSVITFLLNTVYGGLLFLKFVAPNGKVVWSEIMTLSNINGMPCLEFRLGNTDGSSNLLIDARARLTYSYLIEYLDECGTQQSIAQTQDLKLMHDNRMKLDEMVWTLRHMIDESSPLFGLDFREFPGNSIYQFEACINATQKHTGAPIFCQTAYVLEDILIGHRFVDQVTLDLEKRNLTVDYANFNETKPHPVWYPTNRNQHISFRPPSKRIEEHTDEP